MSNTLCRVYVHLVWSTEDRVPRVEAAFEARIWGAMRSLGERRGCEVVAVGGVEDHVHALIWLNPACDIASIVHGMKLSASGIARVHLATTVPWQRGYGVFPVSPRQVPGVRRYIIHQRERHARGDLIPALERYPIDPPDDGWSRGLSAATVTATPR